jgi:hypothetical protein
MGGRKYLVLIIFLLFFACKKEIKPFVPNIIIEPEINYKPQKFEPAKGKVLLFVGQELESIGGTDNYKDGYYDHFPAPGGFTAYTGFGGAGLAGLTTTADWGDGPENMSIPIADTDFKNACLSIGLDISNGGDEKTANGSYDDLIQKLGEWIKELGNRPVFLRIGYEFDGHDWNHYKSEFYKPAFKRIHQKFDAMGITNIAYVWQSKGGGSTRSNMDEYYPGDELVDWVGFSFFTTGEVNHPMLQFAKDHHKPCFIAEATPVFADNTGTSKNLDLTQTADAEWAWNDWFMPFFNTVESNLEVIKAVHYINSPWKTRPLWKNNNFFKNIDARITKNEYMKKQWLSVTGKDRYVKASDTLFNYLYNKK